MERSPELALTIGELSRRSGVPVRTIRFYSDIGLVPESGRSDAGYRRYDGERNRLLTDYYYDEVFGGLDIDPDFEQRMRSVTPDLPDDPRPEQVEAWVELAELVRDPEYRRRVRQMAQAHSDLRKAGEAIAPEPSRGLETVVLEHAGAALADGVAPASPQGNRLLTPIVDAMRGERPDTPELRSAMAARFATGADRAVERYWRLMGVINGWPASPEMTPAFEWTIEALRAHPNRA